MSSDDDDRDPVMELLEALAAERGFRLVPKLAIRSPLDVRLDHLAAELAQLPTDALADRIKAMQTEASAADMKMGALRKRYSQLDYSLPGISLPGAVMGSIPIPERLRAEQKWAGHAASLALQILGRRMARQALDEIENLTVEAEPQSEAPANPAA